MTADDAGRVVEVLDADTCLALLRSTTVGRVGINRRGHGPLVVPVVYAVDDHGTVVFRTDVGTKLAHIARGAVSFQADGWDEASRTGWSVLVDGLAHELDATESAALAVEPWLTTPLRLAVRIVPSTITGRRIVPGDPVGEPARPPPRWCWRS